MSPIQDDPEFFLTDFGVSVTAGAVSGFGILDMPGLVVADGMVISTDYTLRCLASEFGNLAYSSGVVVDSVAYTVREVRLLDDGVFCEISLQKADIDEIITPAVTDVTYVMDGDFL